MVLGREGGRGFKGEGVGRGVEAYIFCFRAALQVWLDGFVLFVELGQIRDEIFDNVGVGERVDAGFVGCVWWDAACTYRSSACARYCLTMARHTQASQCVDSINVHCATPTDSLPTTPPKCQGRIHLIFYSNQRVQHHWPSLVQIESVRLHLRLLSRSIWRPTIDVKSLCSSLLGLIGLVDGGGLLWRDGWLSR